MIASLPSQTGDVEKDGAFRSRQAPGQESAIAGAMPWVMSVLFHLGTALVLVFVTLVVLRQEPPLPKDGPIVIGAIDENPPVFTPVEPSKTFGRDMLRRGDRPENTKKGPLSIAQPVRDASSTFGKKDRVSLKDYSSLGGLDKTSKDRWIGPWQKEPSKDSGGADYVVFVIDRSGSMVSSFHAVSVELVRSIGRMGERHHFDIVLFASGEPIEFGPGKLVQATQENTLQAVEFFKKVVPEGRTDPVPAMRRAFEVLRGAGARASGKAIYLLTDAEFPDSAAVLSLIEACQTEPKVRIHTILYGRRPKAAEEVMRRIASGSGGLYNYVGSED